MRQRKRPVSASFIASGDTSASMYSAGWRWNDCPRCIHSRAWRRCAAAPAEHMHPVQAGAKGQLPFKTEVTRTGERSNWQNVMLKFSCVISLVCNEDTDVDVPASASVFSLLSCLVLSWLSGTKTVRYQSEVSTRHFGNKKFWRRNVRTLRHRFFGAEVSGYRTVCTECCDTYC